jgi:hypothetical protein
VVKAFSHLPKLPTGIRHLWFLLLLLKPASKADFIFCPDTFSAAVPAVLVAKILRKKIIIRTGGDFLWEWYVERTGDLVLLKDFYSTRMSKLSLKERLIFYATRFSLQNANLVAFSTAWQRDLFYEPYTLDSSKTRILENYYGTKIQSFKPTRKDFIAGVRPLKWKNSARVAEAFNKLSGKGAEAVYDPSTAGHDTFQDKIAHSYAVIMATLGDVSPNIILDAIRADKPFILTRETGFYDKLKDVALWVDPESSDDISTKIAMLCDPVIYETYQRKVAQFMFTHSWEEISSEIIRMYRLLP